MAMLFLKKIEIFIMDNQMLIGKIFDLEITRLSSQCLILYGNILLEMHKLPEALN